MKKAIVIGSTNVDIIARALNPFQKYDSNPSNVSISWGGVGRNIVENLARLGTRPSFLTVLGNDLFGLELKKSFDELGIDYQASIIMDEQSSLYLALINPFGSLEMASSSTNLIENIKEKDIELKLEYLNSFDYVIIDTNLSDPIIAFIFNNVTKPIIVDATSAHKAIKLLPFLSKIALLKCNQFEAKALTNHEEGQTQIKDLYQLGVKEIIITQGPNDIYCYNGNKIIKKPVKKITSIINETGAGDAFTSGIIYGKLNNYSLEKCLLIGELLAKETLNVVGAVCQYSTEKWHELLEKIKE